MSGSELIEALHSRGIPLPTRTLVVSVADASLIRHEVEQTGVADVVQKPLLPNVLRRFLGTEKEMELSFRQEQLVPRPGCLQGMPILGGRAWMSLPTGGLRSICCLPRAGGIMPWS
jgi:hypothetical protein